MMTEQLGHRAKVTPDEVKKSPNNKDPKEEMPPTEANGSSEAKSADENANNDEVAASKDNDQLPAAAQSVKTNDDSNLQAVLQGPSVKGLVSGAPADDLLSTLTRDEAGEWDDLGSAKKKTTEHPAPKRTFADLTIPRVSLFKPVAANTTGIDKIRGALRNELQPQRKKRMKTGNAEVGELIYRLSSTDLLRTSKSGRILGESAGTKSAGETNATFADEAMLDSWEGGRRRRFERRSRQHLMQECLDRAN